MSLCPICGEEVEDTCDASLAWHFDKKHMDSIALHWVDHKLMVACPSCGVVVNYSGRDYTEHVLQHGRECYLIHCLGGGDRDGSDV